MSDRLQSIRVGVLRTHSCSRVEDYITQFVFRHCQSPKVLSPRAPAMSVTIQQVLSDAKRLATKLKEDDTAADALLSQAQFAYKKIDAMKQVSVLQKTE